MELALQNLTNHIYLDKKGNQIKKPRINAEQVLEAFNYLITLTEGKLSQRLLKLTFTDKFKDFETVLLKSNYIKLVRPSKSIKINVENGEQTYLKTTNVYQSVIKVENISTDNKYIKSLPNKLKNKPKYQWLLSKIEDTLSRTTLDGEKIGTDIQYTKGRYYGPYTEMSKETRKRLEIDGKRTVSYDIKSAIFQLLSINKVEGIEPLELNGDFYKEMERKFNLPKKELLKQVFCHHKQQDERLDCIPFFFTLRGFKMEYGYKTVHGVYQFLETKLMTSIYESLSLNKIDFLPMHDSVIFKEIDYYKVREVIEGITNVEFKLEY